MRRYGRTTDGAIVAGKNAGLKLALAPLTECTEAVGTVVEPCAVAIDGLYWFSDESGNFDATVEAAAPAGPVLAIAKLVGDICDEDVIWTTECNGETYGPILLNVIQSICCPDITGLCVSFRPFGSPLE